jgi:hypothetical protein
MANEHLRVTSGAFDTLKLIRLNSLSSVGTATPAAADKVIADEIWLMPETGGSSDKVIMQLEDTNGADHIHIPSDGLNIKASRNKNLDLSNLYFAMDNGTGSISILYRSTGKVPS